MYLSKDADLFLMNPVEMVAVMLLYNSSIHFLLYRSIYSSANAKLY